MNRVLEKRIAAVEARVAPARTANMRVFYQPDGADPAAFEAQCRAEAAGADHLIVVFVGKRADGLWDL